MSERACYVGIDTSNYTTSAAAVDTDGRVIANVRKLLPVNEGEKGLRQSDALFAHTRNLPEVMEELGRALHPADGDPYDILGVGYSAAPRRMKDSYMPCFLAGISAASTMRAATGATLAAFSHQEGHVMAALYSAGRTDLLADGKELIAFHVSGGTTDMLLVHPAKIGFDVRLIGQSLDLHAGQAIDRIGVGLGLKFPCGRDLERLAEECSVPVPKPKISVVGPDCHLSGLENLALTLHFKTRDKALTAAYTLDFIGETLSAMAAAAQERYPGVPMVFAGGVMSNKRIRKMIEGRFEASFAEPEYSTDNAAGIALLCRRAIMEN